MTTAPAWLMGGVNPATSAPWLGEMERDLWLYRDRTIGLLKRYARSSVEVGRLPSLLGREFFRARVSSYPMKSFEDVMIFVHDMEQALAQVSELERKLIAMNILEEYTQWQIARLMGCSKRWVEVQVGDAIDAVTRVLLATGIVTPMYSNSRRQKTCQEGETRQIPASDSKGGKNIF